MATNLCETDSDSDVAYGNIEPNDILTTTRSRGPYRRYLHEGIGTGAIPRQTRMRWRQSQRQEEFDVERSFNQVIFYIIK